MRKGKENKILKSNICRDLDIKKPNLYKMISLNELAKKEKKE